MTTSPASISDADSRPASEAGNGSGARTRSVYFFGGGAAEGTKDMKMELGGKGANLAEMTNLGVPVPPGFTIACHACMDYLRDRAVPPALHAEVTAAIRRLEET